VEAEGEEEGISIETAILGAILQSENRRIGLTILFWTVALTATYAQALYQNAHVGLTDQLIAMAICVLAAASIQDVGKAILGYVASIFAAVVLVFLITIIPIIISPLSSVTMQLLFQLWITIFFQSLFPIPFTIYLAGSIIGGIAGERFL